MSTSVGGIYIKNPSEIKSIDSISAYQLKPGIGLVTFANTSAETKELILPDWFVNVNGNEVLMKDVDDASINSISVSSLSGSLTYDGNAGPYTIINTEKGYSVVKMIDASGNKAIVI